MSVTEFVEKERVSTVCLSVILPSKLYVTSDKSPKERPLKLKAYQIVEALIFCGPIEFCGAKRNY